MEAAPKKKGPGRPPGSKNKSKAEAKESAPAKRGPGRPKKVKEETEQAQPKAKTKSAQPTVVRQQSTGAVPVQPAAAPTGYVYPYADIAAVSSYVEGLLRCWNKVVEISNSGSVSINGLGEVVAMEVSDCVRILQACGAELMDRLPKDFLEDAEDGLDAPEDSVRTLPAKGNGASKFISVSD